MKHFKNKIHAFLIGWFLTILTGFPIMAHAVDYEIDPDPLFLGGSVDANIMFVFDDSGSMEWDIMPPDANSRPTYTLWPPVAYIYGASSGTLSRSASVSSSNNIGLGVPYFKDYVYSMRARSRVNTLYYNPSITYTPWSNPDSSPMPNANPECALHNPVHPLASRFTAPVGPFPKSTSDRLRDYNNPNGCLDVTRDFTVRAWWRKYDADSTSSSTTTFGAYSSSIGRRGGTELTFMRNNSLSPRRDRGVVDQNPPAAEYVPGYRQHYAWVRRDTHTFYPATYYRFLGNPNTLSETWDRVLYDRIEIKPANAPFVTRVLESRRNRTDCAIAETCTYQEEIQNFANWYTYYRSRALSAKAGIGQAFARQSTNLRIGIATINQLSSSSSILSGIRPFIDRLADPGPPAVTATTDRTNFFNLFYNTQIGGGTPLLNALDQIGQYYQSNQPWQTTPGVNDSNPLECRQSFSILMTDGFWNGALNVSNIDGTSGNQITGPDNDPYTYIPAPPFSDSYDDTLADVAMNYWVRDLRPGLSNRVPTSTSDPAFWQHMVTFTIGFGVIGTIPINNFPQIENGTIPWPQVPGRTNLVKIDDLWHAGVNGHGGYFSAANPIALADGLTSTLNTLADRVSSSASVALNSGSTAGAARVYQAKFDSGDWTGELISFELNDDGSLGPEKWRASEQIEAWNRRKILTYSGTTGQRFQWSQLTREQKRLLLGSSRILKFIRGDDRREERNNGLYRDRNPAKLLGDIIHSAPAYVGKPSFNYPDTWENGGQETPYSAFVAANANRKPLIYVGAGDGMLHAFREDTNGPNGVGPQAGKEVFAYVPLGVFDNLAELAYPTARNPLARAGDFGSSPFSHQFFVDGSPTVVDAFFGSEWHTVLVSGLNSGGQSVFAIDVTNPNNFNSENRGRTKVLWEFTDKSYNNGSTFDNDLGFTFSQPNVVRIGTSWYVIFGNGYNATVDNGGDGSSTNDSTSGNAVIYILDVQTGALVKKIDTGVGSSDPASGGFPNGISGVSPIDNNGDGVVDALYAGDLFGNLWKINIPNNPANASIANGGVPLFTACAVDESPCMLNNRQSITSRPQVGSHPTDYGQMIYFGTGSYFKTLDADPINQFNVQTFYGIWDKYDIPSAIGGIPPVPFATFTRGDLLEQSILNEVAESFNGTTIELRETSDIKIDFGQWKIPFPFSPATNPAGEAYLGWHLDLINTAATPLDHKGERQISDAVLRNGRIIFITIIPDRDPCSVGGDSWLMELNATDGSRLVMEPFDLNGDGEFTDADRIQGTIVPGGKKSTVGITSTPGIAVVPPGPNITGHEVKLNSGSSGDLEATQENSQNEQRRRSWVHLK